MPLSWNEIRDRALAFSLEWADEQSERSEAKTFWDGFFNVFGISRRRVASFEEPVKRSDGRGGYIDLLWKGVLLVEHKSKGKDLDIARGQALDYFPGLKERDLPRYVLVSDFARIRLYDLDRDSELEIPLSSLHAHVQEFAFIAGYKTKTYGEQDPVNIKAARVLGALHDRMKEVGYVGHPLEMLLVRILFCLFAEDTAIFERRTFQDYLENRTLPDGSDVGMHLSHLFEVLNTPPENRLKTLDEELGGFPYINGRLFNDVYPIASFDRSMRETLLDCCAVDWSEISPAIFGSLFQSITDPEARRHLGAHYTSEANILKVLRPLFMDALNAEFGHLRALKHGSKKRLKEFHQKLTSLRILDPACGCGNFLVVAYREIRLLELAVIRELHGKQLSLSTDPKGMGAVQVDVDQFYGIELEDFPAQIAQVALWLTDHQMNLRVSEEFGRYYARLPLLKGPTIVYGNAIDLDWNKILPAKAASFVLGNPPFSGKKEQSAAQKADLQRIWRGRKGAGILDYVTCWYQKAVEYISENPRIQVGFVSTNSITQGEQVSVLWRSLLADGVRINFAHRTFQWSSEAPGKAAVHCVIVGFGLVDLPEKWLFEYDKPTSAPHAVKVDRINPYLADAPDVLVTRRTSPLDEDAPQLSYGSMPIDAGFLIMDDEEKSDLLLREKSAAPYIRRYGGGEEAISNDWRYCLWLVNCTSTQLRRMPLVLERVRRTKEFRESSGRPQTVRLALEPALFGEIRQPSTTYLLVPKVSSVNRRYLPIAFFDSDVIANGSALIMPTATHYEFGVLQSRMHMSWVRNVGGAMKSDLQYSVQIVYNNFPWPSPTPKQRAAIESAAGNVLEVRGSLHPASLADLYDSIAMPQSLVRAHLALDKAVEAAYRRRPFSSDAQRLAHLLELYAAISEPAELGLS